MANNADKAREYIDNLEKELDDALSTIEAGDGEIEKLKDETDELTEQIAQYIILLREKEQEIEELKKTYQIH